MQEAYLHYLWRLKRLNFNHLKLANLSNNPIIVEETGWYNLDAGPDFFNGTVIINGIKWVGNIEMHVKSSDWYLHKHHLDPAYQNVILHVVYEHDKAVQILGKEIPTVEIKQQIDQQHWKKYHQMMVNRVQIPCASHLKNHVFALQQQIDLSFLNRMERKGLELHQEMATLFNKNNLFLFAIFQAVGGKTNRLPMQELAHRLNFSIIQKEKWDQSRLEALLFGTSGLLPTNPQEVYVKELCRSWSLLQHKHKLRSMQPQAWKYGGIRPYSFPPFILAQLAALLFQFPIKNWEKTTTQEVLDRFQQLSPINIHPYWKTHFRFGKSAKPKKLHFSSQFIKNTLINGIAPAYITMKHHTNDYSYTEKTMELMEALPPEENTITRYWKSIGFTVKNALESQGIIEMNNEFCHYKKCLSCKVGCEILEKSVPCKLNKADEKNRSKNHLLF